MTNEVLKALEERRSVRGYTAEMPSQELIDTVIKAGIYAPTGRGAQSPIIVAVTDKATRDLLSSLNAQVMGCSYDPFYGAPVVLVVLADRTYPTYLYDGSLVMGNLMNAAAAMGIGSCWVNRAMESFDLPEGKASGLKEAMRVLRDVEGIGICELTNADVVRHVLVQRIVAAYDKYEKSRLPDDHARKFTQKPQTKRNLK